MTTSAAMRARLSRMTAMTHPMMRLRFRGRGASGAGRADPGASQPRRSAGPQPPLAEPWAVLGSVPKSRCRLPWQLLATASEQGSDRMRNQSVVVDQPLAQAHDIVDRVADALVEVGCLAVVTAHLEVELRTSQLGQSELDLGHHRAPESVVAVLRIGRKVVHPAAVAVVAGHRCRHDTTDVAYQEQLGLGGQLSCDMSRRGIVPGRTSPQRSHSATTCSASPASNDRMSTSPSYGRADAGGYNHAVSAKLARR